MVIWRPAEVVPKHRRRGVALWITLIAGIIVYSGFRLEAAIQDRNNPSTAVEISNIVYEYPDFWVCLYETRGCDSGAEVEAACVLSAVETEAWNTSAIYWPYGSSESLQTIYGQAIAGSQGQCVEFETSKITRFLGEERDPSRWQDHMLLEMSWYPSGAAETPSTTCVAEGWKDHSEYLYAYLKYPEDDRTTTGIQLPFGCITNTSASHPYTFVGLGSTREEKLGGETSVTYFENKISTANRKYEADPTLERPYNFLSLQIEQRQNSLEIITDIDPFDLAGILGNIGGFWHLLLILWPIFFVAATRRGPHLEARWCNGEKNTRTGADASTKTTTSSGASIRTGTGASTARSDFGTGYRAG